jgi:hypothetical protein
MNKDTVIGMLSIALIITIFLYISALNDLEQAERYAQRFYQVLPEAKQREIMEAWETRQALLGDAP